MKYYLMGLKHFKNVAIACAPDNVGLAHELIGALRDSEVMPFDFTLLDRVLKAGPRSLSIQVAQDAINGARHSSVSDCYYFLYAASTNRTGVVIGGNVFFTSW